MLRMVLTYPGSDDTDHQLVHQVSSPLSTSTLHSISPGI